MKNVIIKEIFNVENRHHPAVEINEKNTKELSSYAWGGRTLRCALRCLVLTAQLIFICFSFAVPVFGNMPNGVTLPNHPNFINQLAAAITTATVGVVTPTATNSAGSNTSAQQTAAATPNNKTTTGGKLKPHNAQGSVPMDLENDNDLDDADVTPAPVKTADKLPGTGLTLPDAQQLYINGLMHTPPGYLYFPTPQNAAAAAAAAAAVATAATTPSSTTAQPANPSMQSNTNAQMLMDPTAMMAAAMQQMQHNYAAAGYAAAAAAAGMPPDASGAGVDASLSTGND